MQAGGVHARFQWKSERGEFSLLWVCVFAQASGVRAGKKGQILVRAAQCCDS